MNWVYPNYTVDLSEFDPDTYNEQNFFLSETPLTTDEVMVEGEVYFHHIVNLSSSAEVSTENLTAGVEMIINLPQSTPRIPSVNVKKIDQIGTQWSWVESYQGFSLIEQDFTSNGPYNPDNVGMYAPSSNTLIEGVHYKLNTSQILFLINQTEITTLLGTDTFQIDFHASHQFSDSSSLTVEDFVIIEGLNSYNTTLHWQLPIATTQTYYQRYRTI